MKKLIMLLALTLICFAACLTVNAEDGYLFKEDFDGTSGYVWVNGNTTDQSTNLIDTDNDGVADSLYHSMSYSPILDVSPTISIKECKEFVVETRIKFTPRSGANLLNEDNSLKGTGDSNNGGLMVFRMPHNYFMKAAITTDGYLTYGDTGGDKTVSDYKIYADTWYTFRFTMSANKKNYSLYVCDDAGNSYSGPFTVCSYGGSEMTAIGKIIFPYGWYYRSTIDYLYMWDNETINAVDATYLNERVFKNLTSLDPTDSLDVTLKFKYPIPSSELRKITVTNGATVKKTLSEDGRSVVLSISGLDYGKKYAIGLARIKNNRTATIDFATMPTPPEAVFEKPIFQQSNMTYTEPVVAKIVYESYKPEDILYMMVLYDADNTVSRIVTSVSETSKYGREIVTLSALPKNTEVKAKVFVWSMFDSMEPLAPMAEIVK